MHPQPPLDPRKGEFDAVAHHAQGRFAPHGVMEVFRQGNVIRGYASGPFNIEFMTAWGKMWGAQLQQRGDPGKLLIATGFSESVVASLDAISSFKALMGRAKALLPADTEHIWLIKDKVEGRILMLPLLKSAMETNSVAIEVYSDEVAFEARIAAFSKASQISQLPLP